MPRVYLIPQEAPNAFATGRNPSHAAVAVTEGIRQLLNREEFEAVLAHELGHVINRDTLISTMAATIAGALSHLSNMAMWGMMGGGRRSENDENRGNPLLALVGILLAPLAATLTHKPLALANALRKIESWKMKIPMTIGSPATAHLFIVNPFSGESMARLFSTHPPTEERIKRLEEMAQGNLVRVV